jgi:translation initiation factor IF-2
MSGVGVDKLLDNILVLAEIAELKANPNRLATGVVVEANLDKGQGPVATVLVKNGTLKKGDFIIVGSAYGHIRNMLNENKVELTEVLPGQPAKITGLNETPAAGDHFIVSNDEKEVKELAKTIKMQASALQTRLTSEALTVEENGIKKLNIILKTDVHGSLEAIKGLLSKIEVPGAKMHIVRAAIGTINESDIQLAKVSHSIIIGFNIKPNHEVAGIANNNKIKILFFDIIYKLSEEITSLLQGTLDKVMVEEETATAVVQQL